MAIRFPDDTNFVTSNFDAYSCLVTNESTKELRRIAMSNIAKLADIIAIKAGGLDNRSIQLNKLSQTVIDFIGSGGNVTNQADEEDLTKTEESGVSVIKLKDRAFLPANFSGLGKKIIRKNISGGVNTLSKSDFLDSDTVYEIRYDFTLDGSVTFPSNSVLLFTTGSISGGAIEFNNTIIKSTRKNVLLNTDVTGTVLNNICADWFDVSSDGVTNSFSGIQKAVTLGRANKNVIVFYGENYMIGDNTLNLYTSVRLNFSKKTKFRFNLTSNKPAVLLTADVNSNSSPQITENLILGRGLYIEGDTNSRQGIGLQLASVSSAVQISNVIVNKIKIQYFNFGLQLPASNFYLNRFYGLHITQNNININSLVNNTNSGENLNFDFCVLGSSPIGLKSNGGVTGYWFNNCSFDFLQCLYNCNGNQGQDLVTISDSWIEGVNVDQGGESEVHGLVYGNSYVAGTRPHPNRVCINNCKIVNNAAATNLNLAGSLLISNTDAEIDVDNVVISYNNKTYSEDSYKANLLYSVADNVNIRVNRYRIALRAIGNKLLHKNQNILPKRITRNEIVNLSALNANTSHMFGSFRVRGFAGIDSVDSTANNLKVIKTSANTSASIIIEPNTDIIPISHARNLLMFPSVNVETCETTNLTLHYLVRFYTQSGSLASESSTFKEFLFSDGVNAALSLKSLLGKGDVVPYAVRNYRFLAPEDIPNDAAYFLPCIRFQFTGAGESTVIFNDFNLIDKDSELKLKEFSYYQSLPSEGAAYAGQTGEYNKKPVYHNGTRFTFFDGFSINAIPSGTTAQRPVLQSSDAGYTYYDTTILKLIVWTGGTWRESDGVLAGTKRYGTTLERPTVADNYIYAGFTFGNSTLQCLEYWTGGTWRRADGYVSSTLKSGTTAQRPTSNLFIGMQYLDTTLNKLAIYDGSQWRDAMGTII